MPASQPMDVERENPFDCPQPSDVVHWAQPLPSQLDLRRWSEQAKVKPPISEPAPSLITDIPRPPPTTHLRPTHDRTHAAHARRNPILPSGFDFSQGEFQRFTEMASHMLRESNENAMRKGNKLGRTVSSLPKCSLDDARVSKKCKPAVRRQNTHENGFHPPGFRARLETSLTDPELARTSASGIPPPTMLSDHGVNYDYPSNTSTPPAKLHSPGGRLPSSFNDNSRVSGSSSPTAFANVPRTLPLPLQDASTYAKLHPSISSAYASTSVANAEPDDVSMEPDEDLSSNLCIDDPAPFNPPHFLAPAVPRPSALAPTSTPVLQSRPRPFMAPLPIPGASQLRPSQRPPPLGMRPRVGYTSKFQAKGKQFKPPFVKHPAASGLPRVHDIDTGAVSVLGGHAAVSESMSEQRRSLSPIVLDPPHIVAKVKSLGHAVPSDGGNSVLEMSARKPEPMEDEDERETKEANSSADMWACFE